MRCECCDKKLNDYEATARHAETGEFLNTCMKCLDGLGIPIAGREELNKREIPEDDDYSDIALLVNESCQHDD